MNVCNKATFWNLIYYFWFVFIYEFWRYLKRVFAPLRPWFLMSGFPVQSSMAGIWFLVEISLQKIFISCTFLDIYWLAIIFAYFQIIKFQIWSITLNNHFGGHDLHRLMLIRHFWKSWSRLSSIIIFLIRHNTWLLWHPNDLDLFFLLPLNRHILMQSISQNLFLQLQGFKLIPLIQISICSCTKYLLRYFRSIE